MDFITLADEHFIPDLKDRCSEMLLKSLVVRTSAIKRIQKGDVENLINTLQIAIKYRLIDLIWKSLFEAKFYNLNNSESLQQMKSLAEDCEYPNETKEIIGLLEKCIALDIGLLSGHKDNPRKTITLQYTRNFEREPLDFLKFMDEKFRIRSVFIMNETVFSSTVQISHQHLEKLTASLPKIEELFLGVDVDYLPTTLLNGLKEFTCIGLRSVLTLELPEVERINCTLAKIISLTLPKAKNIECRECELLTSINSPKVVKINSNKCTALKSLSLPNAEEVECAGCTSLTDIYAPKAERVNVNECKSIKTLIVKKDCKIFGLSKECAVTYI